MVGTSVWVEDSENVQVGGCCCSNRFPPSLCHAFVCLFLGRVLKKSPCMKGPGNGRP